MRYNDNTAAMNPEDSFYMTPKRYPSRSECLGMLFALASVAFTVFLLML